MAITTVSPSWWRWWHCSCCLYTASHVWKSRLSGILERPYPAGDKDTRSDTREKNLSKPPSPSLILKSLFSICCNTTQMYQWRKSIGRLNVTYFGYFCSGSSLWRYHITAAFNTPCQSLVLLRRKPLMLWFEMTQSSTWCRSVSVQTSKQKNIKQTGTVKQNKYPDLHSGSMTHGHDHLNAYKVGSTRSRPNTKPSWSTSDHDLWK